MAVKARLVLNKTKINRLVNAQKKALEMTAEAVRSDVVSAGVVPKQIGELERSHVIDLTGISWGGIRLIAGGGDVPYGRRQYWHPEYNFRTDKNPNAQGKWLHAYLAGGSKADYAQNAFYELLRQLSRGIIK